MKFLKLKYWHSNKNIIASRLRPESAVGELLPAAGQWLLEVLPASSHLFHRRGNLLRIIGEGAVFQIRYSSPAGFHRHYRKTDNSLSLSEKSDGGNFISVGKQSEIGNYK